MESRNRWKAALPAAVCAVLVGVLLPVAAQVVPDVIYGDDDRLDLHQVKNPKLLSMAGATAALFSAGDVTVDAGSGQATLATGSYGDSYNLCPEEPFRDQQNGAFCSGSLVGPDLLMTAGHCVRSESACSGTKFVFGWGITDKEAGTPTKVAADAVYGCAQLLGREEEGRGADWALVKLDRPVVGRAPLKISRAGTPPKGTPLVVIGHPAGLPTKVAGGASVRDPEPNGYFVANLDTYGGNSGSAVFNARSGLIEGILVRGETDYVWRDGCRVSNVCESDGCRGEDVTKVGALASLIPDLGPNSAFKKPGPAFSTLLKLAEPAR